MNEQNKPIHFPFPSSGIPWKRGRRGRVGGAPSSGGGEAHLDAFVLLLLRVKRMRRRVIGKWEIDCVQSELRLVGWGKKELYRIGTCAKLQPVCNIMQPRAKAIMEHDYLVTTNNDKGKNASFSIFSASVRRRRPVWY